jgi:hypothetical protein
MKLKIGALIVGSLDWESKDYGGACREELRRCGVPPNLSRARWRRERLLDTADSEFPVCVPIRYGRLSQSRGNTFTMVFSPEYEQRSGLAKVIACKNVVTTFNDLLAEAIELWAAESGEKDRGKLSASWGCVTIITPDNFLNHPNRSERQKLLDRWAARVTEQKSYGRFGFSAGDIEASKGAVISAGRLRIAWPTLVGGGPVPFDLLLATATNPEIGLNKKAINYPSVAEIAAAWNNGNHVYYFRCNQLTGIETSDDSAIEKLLR